MVERQGHVLCKYSFSGDLESLAVTILVVQYYTRHYCHCYGCYPHVSATTVETSAAFQFCETLCPSSKPAGCGDRLRQAAAQAEQAVAAAEQREKEAAAAAQGAAAASFAAEAKAEELTSVLKQLQVRKRLLAHAFSMHRKCVETSCVYRSCEEAICRCKTCQHEQQTAGCMRAVCCQHTHITSSYLAGLLPCLH